ncbi:Predicted glycosyl transferase [Lutibacter agarilyticus]|uniref:Predicted glycosyl transferase n=1 Tax=Lutibacter agarilyticus TaxID=1109740 RepID=A0A238VZE5_9FLAO|nr:glycosyltransferase [Lutibacter agarilyticus]SNR39672.1 Predicted glycosyl transferase [Lutibacter agarilyticus]
MGHATRCIPIIEALIKAGFEPVLASDGEALLLLQKEFPFLKSYTLPSYNIRYAKSGKNLKFKLFFRIPFVFLAIKKEQKVTAEIIEKEEIKGIISDNRFGVYSSKIPSVYITHQLQVLSGLTTKISTAFHQKIIKKFDECWVPDVANELNLSGKLGHLKDNNFNLKYIGILSRFIFIEKPLKYDLLVLLSGPEPQRTLLEEKLLKELKNYKGSVLFVRGVLNTSIKISAAKHIQIKDYLLSEELEAALNSSKLVIARSGYSTIMDVAVLGKKAFFIPTPGQQEQQYLAKKLSEDKITPFKQQDDFKMQDLKKTENYTGFKIYNSEIDLHSFKLFQSK